MTTSYQPVVRSKSVVFLLLIAAFSSLSCIPLRYSPWQTNLSSEKSDLTAKHLERLNSEDAAKQIAPSKITFAILGDPQGNPGDLRRTLEQINKIKGIAFTLILGDLTDYGLKHEYEWVAEALEIADRPVLTTVGNHDGISHGRSLYQEMFGPSNYTFHYAGFKFVMWNNNKNEYGSSHFDFLKEELNDSSIVASHIPPEVDIHTKEEIDSWLALNRERKIIASLHGHRGTSRNYNWSDQEIPYYVVAKNKGVNYTLVTIDPNNPRESRVHFEHCVDSCPIFIQHRASR